MMTRTMILALLFGFLLSSEGAPYYSRVHNVVDLKDKSDVKSLISFLKYFLKQDRRAEVAVVGEEEEQHEEHHEENHEKEKVEQGGAGYEVRSDDTWEADDSWGYQVENEEPEEFIIQEAQVSPTRHEVKEYKYKVDRYTEDHTREQVDEDIRRGLDAWTNTQMSNYLQLSGCPTLKFTQAKDREDPDFTIDFSYNTRLGEKLAVFRRGEQKIYINDAKALQRDWIAHAVAFNTCKMFGCERWGTGDEVMKLHGSWNNYRPVDADYRTLASALGCMDPWRPYGLV